MCCSGSLFDLEKDVRWAEVCYGLYPDEEFEQNLVQLFFLFFWVYTWSKQLHDDCLLRTWCFHLCIGQIFRESNSLTFNHMIIVHPVAENWVLSRALSCLTWLIYIWRYFSPLREIDLVNWLLDWATLKVKCYFFFFCNHKEIHLRSVDPQFMRCLLISAIT